MKQNSRNIIPRPSLQMVFYFSNYNFSEVSLNFFLHFKVCKNLVYCPPPAPTLTKVEVCFDLKMLNMVFKKTLLVVVISVTLYVHTVRFGALKFRPRHPINHNLHTISSARPLIKSPIKTNLFTFNVIIYSN